MKQSVKDVAFRHGMDLCGVAGIGEFGWMGLVMTPDFGPRNRFGAVLTTLELEPDPVYTGLKLCDPKKCGICIDVCPTSAMSKYGEGEPKSGDLGPKHFEYCHINWEKCQMGALALTKELGGKEDYITTSDSTPQDIVDVHQRMPILIAAFKALNSPKYNLIQSVTTSHPGGNLVLVSGPIAQELGISGKQGCMGPGYPANATIGRVVNLVILNICRAFPGFIDLDCLASPTYPAAISSSSDLSWFLSLIITSGPEQPMPLSA